MPDMFPFDTADRDAIRDYLRPVAFRTETDEYLFRLSNVIASKTDDASAARVTATGSTTARALADRAADVVRVENYGAVGDGASNDAASIQAQQNGGQDVQLLRGKTYRLDADVIGLSSQRIVSLEGALLVGQGDILGSTVLPEAAKGFWQPQLFIGGKTTGITYASADGRYTAAGAFAFVEAQVVLSSIGSASGAVTLSGIPQSFGISPSARWPLLASISTIDGATRPEEIVARFEGGVFSFWRNKSSGNLRPLLNSEILPSFSFAVSVIYPRV